MSIRRRSLQGTALIKLRFVATAFSLCALAQTLLSAEKMSAVRIHEPGGREQLKLEQVPRPTPGTGEMLIRVHAAGVNPVDWKIRQSGGRMFGLELPFTLGFDVSGVVVEMGEGLSQFRVGDEVFAMLALARGGGYADYAIVRFDEAAKQPAKASHINAASVPLAALTAWQALFDTAKLEKGQTVLIHAGAGGVGVFAVQVAKWKGATVIATASERNHQFLRELGADQVIDYRTQRFQELIKDVDVVLDSVGGQTQADSFKVLKKGGILVSIVGQPSRERADEAGVRAVGILVKPDSAQLAQIAKLIDEDQLKPIVSHVFPLADVAKAHEQSETGHTRGKIVLRVVED